MKYRFVEALNNYLNLMGRKELINPQLDCHSNIQLEMNESPSINIDLSGDEIIIWSHIAEHSVVNMDMLSYSLLNMIIEYIPKHFQPGQPALHLVDDMFMLSAVIKPSALDDIQLFSGSFEEFFEYSSQIRTLLVS
ncbi:type III secretion system protein [Providencia sneebia]|uniref:Type III secretion system protein n=1 Tax=Providencia sneebia DSM 19967 TaxID=1141660 RepID=K8WLS1_9GAMM|nr:type III secretion system protein [Providencia sneebia]EKT60891.1 type III secretion system protein [Providencia sneebia DSM 19967]